MSQAEELLDELSNDDIALYSANPETEEHVVIDKNRFITVPEPLKRIAVQYDNNVETIIFDCPRYWDEHDLSTMYVYINYITAGHIKGRYLVKNLIVDEADTNIIHFEWTISKDLTIIDGKIKFLVCAVQTDENGNDEIHWNTEINEDLFVSGRNRSY